MPWLMVAVLVAGVAGQSLYGEDVKCNAGEGERVEAAERFGAGTERGLPATRGGKGLRVTTDWGRPWESHNMKT